MTLADNSANVMHFRSERLTFCSFIESQIDNFHCSQHAVDNWISDCAHFSNLNRPSIDTKISFVNAIS